MIICDRNPIAHKLIVRQNRKYIGCLPLHVYESDPPVFHWKGVNPAYLHMAQMATTGSKLKLSIFVRGGGVKQRSGTNGLALEPEGEIAAIIY